ncbi:hypothetical protein [Demequina sp. NBRC 110054]|uniref:hypothetical protein n=1 Tax=Demequina sp. NBRC 110054 TaxID=1570343 RepID=UPI001178C3AB|nr:hypothetical protein [Demequina sp. NBRC 110054]
MPVPRRMSVVHRTTMRAVALGAAAGLSVGGASAASASETPQGREAATTTQSLQIVESDEADDILDERD